MDAHAILSRLWRDEDVTEAKANFPLWVMWRYAAKHGGARLDPLREDMEQVAFVATERALRTYDANKGTLPSWIRLLVERDLSKLLEAERNQTRGNVTPPHDELAPERRDAIDHLDPPGEASTERDVFERWRRRVVLEAVKGLPERQAKAVTLYFRLDNWPYRRTDAQVGDELYVTAKAAEQLRRRGVEGLREMGLPRELLDETPAAVWPPPSRRASHRQARPTRLDPGALTPGLTQEWDHRRRPNPVLRTIDLEPGEELPESA
jgi:RNA polymerase sigma factor (sigma-70 family)